ncbi:Chk1 protein kinase [Nowakowskiella sp. JEL0407]|nr:Chk1 protein kinase [Nowakowskiella sp. JEL0407]
MLQNSQNAKLISHYEIGQTLGEGGNAKYIYFIILMLEHVEYLANCRVKLGRNRSTNELVAVKIILYELNPNFRIAIEKECRIHASLMHLNILKFVESFSDDKFVYMILEFAEGGELFELISPDVGVQEELAHFFFLQLLAGMEYMHQRGITHRDLKPENLLLDKVGNLKISDFGHATVFSTKGKTRTLNTACGSPPYIAPEILVGNYDGKQVDIWSAGIILFVLLVGNTPWAAPVESDEEFLYYLLNYDKDLSFYAWNRINPDVLGLIKGMMNPEKEKRYTMNQIKMHEWTKRPSNMIKNGKCKDPMVLAEKLLSQLHLAGETNTPPISFSQPDLIRVDFELDIDFHAVNYESFSQPTHTNAYAPIHESISQKPFRDIIPNESLTRFYSDHSNQEIFDSLKSVLNGLLVQVKSHVHGNKVCQITLNK